MKEKKRPDQITLTLGEKIISEIETVMAILITERRLDRMDFSAYARLIHREFMAANKKLLEKYKDLFKGI